MWVRKPTPPARPPESAPAFKLDRGISGLKVGLRVDHAWRSWQLIAELWSGYLQRDGATTVVWHGGAQSGSQGAEARKVVAGVAADVDCAIIGLGTCGSCTTYTIRDSVIVEDAEKPVVAMICEEFLVHARHVAKNTGHDDLKICVLPYPLEARPEAELRAIADEYYPKVLELLGAGR
jgi:hypothetical protein